MLKNAEQQRRDDNNNKTKNKSKEQQNETFIWKQTLGCLICWSRTKKNFANVHRNCDYVLVLNQASISISFFLHTYHTIAESLSSSSFFFFIFNGLKFFFVISLLFIVLLNWNVYERYAGLVISFSIYIISWWFRLKRNETRDLMTFILLSLDFSFYFIWKAFLCVFFFFFIIVQGCARSPKQIGMHFDWDIPYGVGAMLFA